MPKCATASQKYANTHAIYTCGNTHKCVGSQCLKNVSVFCISCSRHRKTKFTNSESPIFTTIFLMKFNLCILLTSSKNQIYEFRIPNIYNYFFNNIRLMYTLCFLVASVKLKVYKKVVKFSFKQQKILGIWNS